MSLLVKLKYPEEVVNPADFLTFPRDDDDRDDEFHGLMREFGVQ